MSHDLPSDTEMRIIAVMSRAGGKEMMAPEIVRQDRDQKLSENSIYVLLTRAVARGFLAARKETPEEKSRSKSRGPRRVLFTLTGYGQQQYDARVAAERAAARQMVKGGFVKPVGAL